jgi:hypothetical protein
MGIVRHVVRRKCVAAAASGETCTTDSACAAPLECVLGKCAAGPSVENGPCLEKDDCVRGLYCERLDGGAGGTCKKEKLATASCTASAECVGRCVPPGATGTCTSFCGSL